MFNQTSLVYKISIDIAKSSCNQTLMLLTEVKIKLMITIMLFILQIWNYQGVGPSGVNIEIPRGGGVF